MWQGYGWYDARVAANFGVLFYEALDTPDAASLTNMVDGVLCVVVTEVTSGPERWQYTPATAVQVGRVGRLMGENELHRLTMRKFDFDPAPLRLDLRG